jgi:predicted amidohydrolase YtcJ
MTRAIPSGLLAALLLSALLGQASAQPADLILRNGTVHTVDAASRTAAAVAIRGDRFLAVGDDATVMKEAGPNTQVVDLGGRTVIPGLIDTHLHMASAALNRPAVKLLEARSVADVQRAVAARVAETPPRPLGGRLLRLARKPARRRAAADPLRARPGLARPSGLHPARRACGHINSRALELAGIKKDTPDPDGGVIVRDPATGESTGVLLEPRPTSPAASCRPAAARGAGAAAP